MRRPLKVIALHIAHGIIDRPVDAIPARVVAVRRVLIITRALEPATAATVLAILIVGAIAPEASMKTRFVDRADGTLLALDKGEGASGLGQDSDDDSRCKAHD
ncbi:hypothetical protein Moror_12616 [Moniliophthora roreri MCA 2997]|uniref:Uncharacterized protein n=2 Tax=Moniliophthora roreri TaxID=221103 RepID=V2YV98_MONRO|nr:hypothetical protein Moror_12616 [Moniliophthora roreri MCA 2997]